MNEDWITTAEAAEISGYHPEYIRYLLNQGKVKGQKWGQSWQVSRGSLLAYMETGASTQDKRWGGRHS